MPLGRRSRRPKTTNGAPHRAPLSKNRSGRTDMVQSSAPARHVPPQNIEAEESVLGAMLVAEPTLSRVIDEVKLNASDFYLAKHATISTCIHDLYAASKPVDELTVRDAL